MTGYDIVVMGGGLLGTCISYWLSSLFDARVCVVEKEPGVAMHASGRNTGVVHSPFYMDPDSKAELARSALVSYDMWKSLAAEQGISWKTTGVFELALDERQHKSLERYMAWGERNGIPPDSLRMLDSRQVSKKEPNVKCHSAIFSSREASTDFAALARAVQAKSARNGTKFVFGGIVRDIKRTDSGCLVDLGGSEISARLLINCAGGNSLDIAQMLGLAEGYSDLHFRGEYWIADPRHQDMVRSTVYTVAEFPKYPFLDPHWIKKSDGTTEVGPNAVPVPGPEVYSGYLGDPAASIAKLRQVLTGGALRLFSDPEFLTLLSREWLSSLSKTAMISRIQKFIPGVRPEMFSARGTAGIRSPVITSGGRFVPDVMELGDESSFHIVNYNSPGATGAPAYAGLVVDKLRKQGILDLRESGKDAMWSMDAAIGS